MMGHAQWVPIDASGIRIEAKVSQNRQFGILPLPFDVVELVFHLDSPNAQWSWVEFECQLLEEAGKVRVTFRSSVARSKFMRLDDGRFVATQSTEYAGGGVVVDARRRLTGFGKL